ncbi:class I SAM-dependent methyltransferase [Rhodococcoides kyotonense]|uniref:Ubiquinone/menaquinone biosynthesis C-methylase UbiE n=1 Tax=Rhodococcoides kyotonense TaxID=398843 RepID=A0A239LI47_9NOCA|nr:class I SAM-dependent methyltransferase [Rhodococcus kyotonensis]SNT29339.1 Ubiquinone/menaquinone biosynthesis C-methylase UbiE [Rhodococcus kyotonensis]
MTHSGEAVAAAYSSRATEYVDLFGTMESVHPDDHTVVLTWARGLKGPVVDAGCGPGHWTHLLAEQGVEIEGVDLSEQFIEHARRQYPGRGFRVGDISALGVADGSLGGILSWYSTIHYTPDTLREPLTEFARALAPGGGVLLGFFEGPEVESFEHAVITAYRWPAARLAEEVEGAGFEVVETHTRQDPGTRPHGSLIARRL